MRTSVALKSRLSEYQNAITVLPVPLGPGAHIFLRGGQQVPEPSSDAPSAQSCRRRRNFRNIEIHYQSYRGDGPV